MSAPPGVAQIRARPRMNVEWQEYAECVGYDPEMWFDPDRYHAALAVCGGCPVQSQCRELGKGKGEGVWGGRIQRGQPKRRDEALLRPHGTAAAYRRHQRRGEDICPTCSEGAQREKTARPERGTL